MTDAPDTTAERAHAALERVASGEWERGPALAEAQEALGLGLRALRLRHYGLGDPKDLQPLAAGRPA